MFLAKCVFLMTNNLQQERIYIDGILLEIYSTRVCCPDQSVNIWFLSVTVSQRSSSDLFIYLFIY